MYRKIVYPIVLMLMACYACQLPLGNQIESNESEAPNDTTAIAHEELPETADTTALTNPATLTLDEFGMLTEDDPWIYFVCGVDKESYMDHKYIYADGPDSLAFIHIDGKRHILKTVDWFHFSFDKDDKEIHELTTVSTSDDYHVKVHIELEMREIAGSTWTGNITVIRRADGAVYKSDIYGSSSH